LVLDYAVLRAIADRPPLQMFYGLQPGGPDAPGPFAPRVIKPHGSLNFILPVEVPSRHTPNGLALRKGPVEIPRTADGGVCYLSGEDDGKEPYIVPPSPFKGQAAASPATPLDTLRDEEARAVANANEVYVLGWSLPETDLDQAVLISTAAAKRKNAFERVTVVNLGGPPAYYSRIGSIFNVKDESIRIYNAGFSQFVEDTVA
jgi:hypothetical protein